MSYVAIAINIISGILYTPWMISSIGRENFGLFTLANSVITLFVFDFGLSSAVTRFIARYLAEGRQDKANNCFGLVYKLYFSLDIVLFLIMFSVYFYIPEIYRELTPDEIEKFKVIYAVAASYSVLSFPFIPVNGVLSAHEKFIQLKLCDVFHKVFIVASMTFCLLLGYGLYALVLVNAVSGILTIVMKLFCISHYSKQRISWKYFNKQELKQLASYSGWVTVISLSQRCIFSLSPSILGIFSGSTSIAILGIAITLEAYTYTFANAINGMFLPKVSRIVTNEGGNVLPLMIKVGRIQIYIVGLVVFGFFCLGDTFIDLWVGDGFKESYICAVLIILPSFFHLPQLIGNEAIYALNKVKKLAIVFIIMALANLAGVFALVPLLGATGVCISICVAYLIRTIGMDVIFHKDLHIDIWQFFKASYISTLFPLIVSIILGILVIHFIPIAGWSGLVLKTACFGVIYGLIMYIFAMNVSERDLLLAPLRKLHKK